VPWQKQKAMWKKQLNTCGKKVWQLLLKRLPGRLPKGVIDAYIHLGGKVGVLVEVNCETDFVAKNEEFRDLVHNIAMQIAAMSPLYIDRDDVPGDVLEKERQIARAQAVNEGKPEHLLDRIADGKIERYLKDSCLLMQSYIKDGDKTVRDILTEAVAKIGENIQIGRFVRFAVGETQEKQADECEWLKVTERTRCVLFSRYGVFCQAGKRILHESVEHTSHGLGGNIWIVRHTGGLY
jgi:hypothetical protein